MLCQQIERKIDAIFLQIHRDVLPEIGELQRGAGGVREALALGIAIAAQIQHQTADGIRRVAAIAEHVVEGLVARHGLVLFEGAESDRSNGSMGI